MGIHVRPKDDRSRIAAAESFAPPRAAWSKPSRTPPNRCRQ